MALDEPKTTDDIFDIEGFQYIVDKDFLEQAKPIKVDFSEIGFKLDCSIDFESGCSDCGSTRTCG